MNPVDAAREEVIDAARRYAEHRNCTSCGHTKQEINHLKFQLDNAAVKLATQVTNQMFETVNEALKGMVR